MSSELEEEEVSWSEDWKAEVSKILKRRGFKEEEEGTVRWPFCAQRSLTAPGLKYHTTNTAGDRIAIKDILKDKSASLDSKQFPLTLHLQARELSCCTRGRNSETQSFVTGRHPTSQSLGCADWYEQ